MIEVSADVVSAGGGVDSSGAGSVPAGGTEVSGRAIRLESTGGATASGGRPSVTRYWSSLIAPRRLSRSAIILIRFSMRSFGVAGEKTRGLMITAARRMDWFA